ncbi:GDP-mannose 4,6-dehydratase [Ruegeria halocynthiae]|uniref:GDP-mannose 4,6-dehydratase n=1 Tax=Ruegeria halocynthiae TaxID=985054 RepID=UPI003AF32161
MSAITGQDGSYLAKPLPENGYEVRGIKRRALRFNTQGWITSARIHIRTAKVASSGLAICATVPMCLI